MKPLLCATVTAPTMAELIRRRDEVAGADMVELRLDSVADPSAAGALAGRHCPVIVTCRPKWEGGWFTGSEEERKAILFEALARGAEYVDVEFRAGFDDVIRQTGGRRVVMSSHDFTGGAAAAADIAGQLAAMRATGAEVVKIAVTATALSDCVTLMRIGEQFGGGGALVLVAMGEHGVATRVLPGRFGSAWTYAGALREIGQVSLADLRDEYRFHSIGDSTGIYGVVGGSVAHSVSPAMHNAAFRALKLDAVYLPLPAVSADDFLAFANAIGLSGASITIPHKVSLFERVDEASAVARRIGAINTIRSENGRWIGENTDASGFLEPIERAAANGTRRASVLGAGGAARAVAVGLASGGWTVTVHARNRRQAEQVAMLAASEVGPWPPAPGSWDLLVNCTPIGQVPGTDETPVPREDLTGRQVYDLVYNPPATRLLREAADAGCETIGGLEMLVGQAREQFRWWTGLRPSPGLMRSAAEKRLSELSS